MQTLLRKHDLSRFSIGYTGPDGQRIVRQFQNDDQGTLVEKTPPPEPVAPALESVTPAKTPIELELAVVGMAATRIYPDDRYPAVVVSVSADGNVITLAELTTVSGKTGHSPARRHGPYPVWDHIYTPEEIATMRTDSLFTAKRKRRNGKFYDDGIFIELGVARYLRDYSL